MLMPIGLAVVGLATSSALGAYEFPMMMENFNRPLRAKYLVEFEFPRSKVSQPLQQFLADFKSWSREERNSIQFDLPNIIVSGLNPARQVAYGGDLAGWLKARLEEMVSPPEFKDARPQIPPYMTYTILFNYLQSCVKHLQRLMI